MSVCVVGNCQRHLTKMSHAIRPTGGFSRIAHGTNDKSTGNCDNKHRDTRRPNTASEVDRTHAGHRLPVVSWTRPTVVHASWCRKVPRQCSLEEETESTACRNCTRSDLGKQKRFGFIVRRVEVSRRLAMTSAKAHVCSRIQAYRQDWCKYARFAAQEKCTRPKPSASTLRNGDTQTFGRFVPVTLFTYRH